MTPVYEVRTKHTKKVLEDFIAFTYKIKYPRVTMNLIVMAACLAVFAFLAKGKVFMYILLAVSAALFIFALARKRIGVSKLAKADKNYQNQSEIHLMFGESGFQIENQDMGQNDRVRYGEISYQYVDDNYYYLSINNDDLQMLPKADFTMGDPVAFYDFITDKTGKPMLPTYLPWKVRIHMMMQYRDARAEAVKQRQEEQKKSKKK